MTIHSFIQTPTWLIVGLEIVGLRLQDTCMGEQIMQSRTIGTLRFLLCNNNNTQRRSSRNWLG